MVNILLTHYKLYLGCSAWGTSRVPRRGTVERLHPGTRTQWRSIDPHPSPDCTLPYWRSCFSGKFCFYMGDSVLSNLFAICPFIFFFDVNNIVMGSCSSIAPVGQNKVTGVEQGWLPSQVHANSIFNTRQMNKKQTQHWDKTEKSQSIAKQKGPEQTIRFPWNSEGQLLPSSTRPKSIDKGQQPPWDHFP